MSSTHGSRAPSAALLVALGSLACQAPQPTTFDELAESALAQLEGELSFPELRGPVEVIRDEWGVPHIFAESMEDMFFAQGFVQAQDRLWQMDMYRRVGEGRLAETFGPEYVRHDSLARLFKFRGPYDDAEWTSYHPAGKRVFDSFAAGVNAFIEHAGTNLPVEYLLTGIEPLPWTAEASVLRMQTALPLGDARSELQLAEQVLERGAAEAGRARNYTPFRELVVPTGLDLETLVAGDPITGLRGMRSGIPRPPVVSPYDLWLGALASENNGVQENSPGSNNWAVSGSMTASGSVIVANDPHRNVSNPSIRYIVHLNAPGWNVIGATEAPLPGVAIGRNESIAWGLTIVGTDQSDVYVEELNPENPGEVRWGDGWESITTVVDTIAVAGEAPRIVQLRYSRHGPIFSEDRENLKAYAVRSTMHEPGAAGYLGALQLAQVEDCETFLDRLQYWKAPTENMVCGDVHGNISWQASALSPRRNGWHGRLPVPGDGSFEWDGFRDDLPRELNPDRGWIATANHDIHPPGYDPPLYFKTSSVFPRYDRLEDVLTDASGLTMDDMRALQMDAFSARALGDAALFRGWTVEDPELEAARVLLAEWDGVYALESAAAALYRRLGGIPATARDTEAPIEDRRAALTDALRTGVSELAERQGADPSQWRWGRENRAEFPHAFISAYDIAPRERPGGAGTVAATGATFRQIIDLGDLDSSLATNAPGQSAQPGSPFYDNLAEGWAVGDYFPMLLTREAIEANARYRLVLRPGL